MSKISCGCAAFVLHIETDSHSAESETASPSLDRKRSKAGGTSVSFVYDGVCVLWLYGSDKANKKCWSLNRFASVIYCIFSEIEYLMGKY